eukprot:scaffold94772_cov28-Tisochrysis_lutea.AAC.1
MTYTNWPTVKSEGTRYLHGCGGKEGGARKGHLHPWVCQSSSSASRHSLLLVYVRDVTLLCPLHYH